MSDNPSAGGPSWYDILGVAPDASAEEIKAAWRDATDKFEPGSGATQFRLFSEAADVLLDPVKRAEYDARVLGAPRAEVAPPPEFAPVGPVEPVEQSAPAEQPDQPDQPEQSATGPVDEPSGLLARLGSSFGLVLVVCVPLLVAALAVAGIARWGFDGLGVNVEGSTDKVAAHEAGREAAAAAERALAVVLAYDYRQMDADRDRAVQFLTPTYAEEFTKTFTLLTEGPDGEEGPAVKTKTVVTADVLGTGVMDASRNRARVVAFVNQNSVKGDANPAIFQNRIVVTMVRRDGAWLIDDVKTY